MAQNVGGAHLSSKDLPVKTVALHRPPVEEVAQVLQKALALNFSEASVNATTCPDLSLPPFNLSSSGLGGQSCLVDIGSSSYLTPLAHRNKIYSLEDIARKVGLETAFIIGAGLGPWPHVGVNCEMIADLTFNNGEVNNHTQVAHIVNGECKLDVLPVSETRCAILVNLFCCKGETDKVLKVQCKGRKGEEDIVSCMRKALCSHYKDKLIGLGGTFLLSGSPAKQHIMPDFSTCPLNTQEAIQAWIKIFHQAPPLIAVGTLISDDPGLDLKVQHFHAINSSGEGGHFYTDTQSDAAEYTGYFALGEKLYKMDQPQ